MRWERKAGQCAETVGFGKRIQMGDYDPFMKLMQEVSFRQGWSILRQIRPSVVRFAGRIEVVVGVSSPEVPALTILSICL